MAQNVIWDFARLAADEIIRRKTRPLVPSSTQTVPAVLWCAVLPQQQYGGVCARVDVKIEVSVRSLTCQSLTPTKLFRFWCDDTVWCKCGMALTSCPASVNHNLTCFDERGFFFFSNAYLWLCPANGNFPMQSTTTWNSRSFVQLTASTVEL